MDEISKVFFTENEYGKISFSFWKTEFGTTANFVHTAEYLAFGVALRARL